MKESLSAMVAGNFLVYTPNPDKKSREPGKFELPEEHALILCDDYETGEVPVSLNESGEWDCFLGGLVEFGD